LTLYVVPLNEITRKERRSLLIESTVGVLVMESGMVQSKFVASVVYEMTNRRSGRRRSAIGTKVCWNPRVSRRFENAAESENCDKNIAFVLV